MIFRSAFASPLAVAATLLLAALPASAATLTGRVIVVHDGDTITLLDATRAQHRIRLAGIDAPGIKQAFGSTSKQNLYDLIYNKQVKVEWEKRDRQKRILGKVMFVPAVCVAAACLNGSDAGREQIASGYAWHYKQYAQDQSSGDRESYAAAEKQAREGKRGLWADPDPVPPWEFGRPRK